MTIAFGQGLNVAPLQAMMAVGALANGGFLITPTFLKRSEEDAKKDAPRVVKPETSEAMRYLMRLNAEIGTAKIADIKGYFVGGKTGTADKIIHGHYSKDRVFTTFMAIIPADKPKYLYLTLYDRGESLGQGVVGRHAEGDGRVADLTLCSDQALGDRRLGQEEGARDLPCRQAAEEPQGEGHLGLGPECRVAYEEDETQPIVLHGAHLFGRVPTGLMRIAGHGCPFSFEQA